MYLVGPVAGALSDAYGPTRLYATAALGTVAASVGVSFAQPGQIWQFFLSQGALFGITVAFGTYVAMPLVSQHFKRRRGLALGLLAGGSSAGGVCLPIMLSKLTPDIGLPWALRVVALITVFCYGVAILISKPKLPPQPLRSARELLDFNGFKDARYSVLALASIVGNFGLYVPYYYIEPYIALHHPESSMGSYLLPLINASSFFGRVIGGFVADHVGALNLLYPLTTIAGLLCLTLWLFANSIGLIVAFTCLYGFCSGVFISVMPSIVAAISPPEKIGARLGAFGVWGAIGVFTGTPIGGAFIRHETAEEYVHLIAYTGSCMAGAGVLLFVARVMCDRNLRSKW
ncbi:major facilitator superfamily domain-containing protein [Plectosphaerella cucumerina]|uniref:Major facilitator superfamily domain-containing protein n=1 Tax=Plectosphaerella cucumerina TaxID=40658 RepID=A0A8K0T4J0_9PEZI|nr:major facilitator superfamily domain-containing protein [Plectosphaerella cucumerina]